MKSPVFNPRGRAVPALLLHAMLMVFVGIRLAAAAEETSTRTPISVLDETTVLNTLRPQHPRLMMLAEDLARIKQSIAADAAAQKYYEHLRERGEAILKEEPVKRVLIGPRLLDKSRRVVDRIYCLGLLYRLDGDQKWFARAWRELQDVAAFSDWNPSHFLDVAEMTHGFAIGYDWFYDAFTPEQRAVVKNAIVEKGLRPAEKAHRQKVGWTTTAFNWNNVCNGGIVSGALAVADEEPELARYLVIESVKKLPKALASYAPDGAWAEGPGYWSYATRYTVVGLASLQSALGTDFGLGGMKGLSEAGRFRIYGNGPADLFFNFADAGEGAGDEPSLFWLARRYQQPVLAAAARRSAQKNSSSQDLMFYDARGSDEDLKQLPLDRHFRGADVVFFRSAWLDRNALFAGFKAGDNKANHSNLDLGTFVLDALGQRWALELGGDDYNLPAYFGNKRWTYYRMRTEGQNTLVLNDENQDPKAEASIIAFQSKAGYGFTIADLTAGYAPGGAIKVQRGMAILDHRQRLLVQDELEAKEPVKVTWGMHTRAGIELDGSRALLTLGGQRLEARLLSPAGARFSREEVNLPPPQKSTAGIRKLLVQLPEKTPQARLAIVFSPGSTGGRPLPSGVKPLKEWESARWE